MRLAAAVLSPLQPDTGLFHFHTTLKDRKVLYSAAAISVCFHSTCMHLFSCKQQFGMHSSCFVILLRDYRFSPNVFKVMHIDLALHLVCLIKLVRENCFFSFECVCACRSKNMQCVCVCACVCVCTYACLRVGVWICAGCVKLKVKNTQHLFLITFLLKISLTSHEPICTITDIT